MAGRRRAVRPRMRIGRRCGAAAVGAGLALAVSVGAAASTDPYASRSVGYDVSYPQCGGSLPAGGSFWVVGVTGGRPFTANGCLGPEYTTGQNRTGTTPSLYLNTGYSGAYGRQITSGCSSGVPAGLDAKHAQAWKIGCSEADDAERTAGGAGASSTAMWWLDVETANSWSSSDLTLNQKTIQGAVDHLSTTGVPVGVYSTPSAWRAITGAAVWNPQNGAADWVAGGGCSTSFSGAAVWLYQRSLNGFDSDTAC